MKFFSFGRIGQNLLITSTISGIIFIAYVFYSFVEIDRQFSDNSILQVRVDEVQTALHTLYESLLNEESGQRGYNLTGEKIFLEAFVNGTEQYNETSKALLMKIDNQPEINDKIKAVIKKGKYWHDEYGVKLIEMTKNGQKPSVETIKQSKIAFDNFRQSLQEADAVAGNLRNTYRDKYRGKISDAQSTLFLISIFLIIVNAIIIHRQTNSIIKPVLELNNSVKAYTKKDFSVGIPQYKKADELAELIKNVNTMRLELHEKFSTIESLAELDGTTGIYNRRYFDQTLETEWTKAKHYVKSISLILFDIDYFKIYNDTYGHLEGDRCLKKISSKLIELFGDSSDIVARFGGEEFAIILPEQNEELALTKAEKLRKAIMELKISHLHSYVHNVVTISVGVASMVPTNGNRQSSHLIALADQALYKSKANGRNQVTQHSDTTITNIVRKKHLLKTP